MHSLHIIQDLVVQASAAATTAELVAAPTSLALGAAVVSVIVKEALYHVTVRVGTQHNSSVVVLNAWHHRVDGLTSLVALAGIGGAMVGFPLADPIAGLLVAGMIVRLGLQSGVDSFRDLTDRQVDGETRAELEALLAQQHGDGVQSYHKLRLRRTGARWVEFINFL
jgi:cation diffusion facilitator family transporter